MFIHNMASQNKEHILGGKLPVEMEFDVCELLFAQNSFSVVPEQMTTA